MSYQAFWDVPNIRASRGRACLAVGLLCCETLHRSGSSQLDVPTERVVFSASPGGGSGTGTVESINTFSEEPLEESLELRVVDGFPEFGADAEAHRVAQLELAQNPRQVDQKRPVQIARNGRSSRP